MKLRKFNDKYRSKLKQVYVVLRKKFLEKWTRIPEGSRKKFFSFLNISFNFLQNALLLAVPVTLLTTVSYLESVIIIWIILPFLEHYYVWLREEWKDELVK